MNEVHPSYQYRPISPNVDEIRLFQIDCTSDEGIITGKLIHVSLSEHPEYNALSHQWGSGYPKISIQVDGDLQLQVSSRINLALQDLRYFGLRYTWIDTICINQADAQERNHQVQQMAQIYAKAKQVLIWLDEAISPQDPSLIAMVRLDANSVSKDIEKDEGFWEPINRIVANKYWDRIWIQQEISSAVCLIMLCRRTEIPISPLVHFHRLRMEVVYRQSTSRVGEGTFALNHVLDRALNSVPEDDTAAHEIRATSNPLFQTHRYIIVYDAIEESRHFEATDPRDKVFALIPFVRSWETLPLTIDYELSVRQVYTQVARHMIDKWRSLEFLCHRTLEGANPEYNLPSWLPDYSTRPSITGLHVPRDMTIFRFQYLTRPVFSLDDRELQAQGFRVGKVVIPYRHLTFQNILHDQPAQKIFKDFEDLILTSLQLQEASGFLDMPPVLPPDLRLIERQSTLFKTLVGTELSKPTEEENETYFHEFLQQIDTLHEMSASGKRWSISYSRLLIANPTGFARRADSIEWPIWLRLQGTTLYISQNGNLGLAPVETVPGDEIWAIFGCKWPLILRPRDDTYLLVGPAVHESISIRDEILENINIPEKELATSIRNGTRWENRQGKFVVETILLH